MHSPGSPMTWPTPVPKFWRPADAEPEAFEPDDERADKRAAIAVVLGGLALLAVLIAVATAGLAGLLIALSAAAVLFLLVVAADVPGSPPVRRRRRGTPITFDEPYPTFKQVSEHLSWAQVSPRHYDLVTRPMLVRLMANRLADHHGIDLQSSPEAARALVGEDVWWWLDPDREPERSSQPPGVDVATLGRLVTRLEAL